MNGLLAQVPGKEVQALAQRQAKWHANQASVTQREAREARQVYLASLKHAQAYTGHSGSETKRAAYGRFRNHQKQAALLAVFAEHVALNETYTLSLHDLEWLGACNPVRE